MDNKERQWVIDFLQEGDNAETFRRILHHYPRLTDDVYVNRFKDIIVDELSIDRSELEHYPHGNRYRIKHHQLEIQVKKWNTKNLPFSLVISNYEKSALRVFLWSEYLKDEEKAKCLNDFACANSKLVVKEYTQAPVGHWGGWYYVLVADEGQIHATDTLIQGEPYDDKFWDQVQDQVNRQVKPLADAIDGRI